MGTKVVVVGNYYGLTGRLTIWNMLKQPKWNKTHASDENTDDANKEAWRVENVSNVKFNEKIVTERIIYHKLTGNTMFMLKDRLSK